jgi:hypothetical protein
MKTLLFIFLVWFPLAVFVSAIIPTAAEFKKIWKKLVFWLIIFPCIWIRHGGKAAAEITEKVPALYKLKDWFLT